MKYFYTLIMLLCAFCLLNGLSGGGSIVIEFPYPINPEIETGVVTIGNVAVDSLNAVYGISDFDYYDLSWTTRLNYLLELHLDDTPIFNIEDIIKSYAEATKNIGTRIEYLGKPEVDGIPGEYLYSDSLRHTEDTIFSLYSDNDAKRNWHIHSMYQYLDGGVWYNNMISYEPFEEVWGPTNLVVVNELDRPFPYRWAFHGHGSLWHHLAAYNNTYKAWDYTEGEQTIAVVLDLQGYWIQHPDLVNRWHPDYTTSYNNHELTPPSNNYRAWWNSRYHGTNCAGALAASKQSHPENEITHLSSVGVAPQTTLIGKPPNVFRLLSFLNSNQELIPSVVSISYSQPSSNWNGSSLLDAYQVLIDMGITVVSSRGYNRASYSSMFGHMLDGYICVGDYRPDWMIKTKYTSNPNNNANPDFYKADINAPGWQIWVPNVYHTFESGVPSIGYSLTMGQNTSISAPQVAGTVCLIKSLYPWMTPAEVERQIKLGAHNLDKLIEANTEFLPNTPAHFFGAGCLDAYGSLYLHLDTEREFRFSNEPNNTALIGRGFALNNSNMTVLDGTLRIEKDAHVMLYNSTLELADNVTVIFEQDSKIELCSRSSLIVGNNVTFKTENNESCEGLLINGNCNQPLTFNNTTFINVPIGTINTEASYNGCTFTRSDVLHNNKSLSITYSALEFSGLQVIQTMISSGKATCSVINSSISNSTMPALSVTGYPKVIIQDNDIHHNYSGIELYDCSNGTIENNDISYNGNGIRLYHSNANIIGHNTITYNHRGYLVPDDPGGYGIEAKHLTSWNLIGENTYPLQIIHDNQREQILMQSNSISTSMYFNKIYSYNHVHPYLRIFWGSLSKPHASVDISNNCWSDDFIPSRDLVPDSLFTYLPLWEPGIPRQILEDEAYGLLQEALSDMNDEDYIVAEYKLKQIITEYPETNASIEAAKQLLILVEEYNKNYDALELYYTTYPALRDDPVMKQLSDYLANFCRMKSGDYPEAIQFFEDLILNPPSMPDSIYAVIDAGYAYLLMSENSDKSSFTGKLKWLKPKSIEDYLELRSQLINNGKVTSSIHSQSPDMAGIKTTLTNYPNPFNPSTTISFYLPEPEDVLLEVFNIKGQRIKVLVKDHKDSGQHQVVWDGADDRGRSASSGIYFYKLKVGSQTITNKMVLMK